MRALRGVLAFIASAVVVAACVLTMSSSPVATAADSTSIEAESMGVSPASAGATVTDKSASQGVALVLRSPATASKTLTLPASATIVVRARGQSCGAAPVMNVAVDGKTISTTKVSSSSWASYTTAISIPAGNHVIGVILTNRRGSYFCQVNLYVDTVTVVASAPTSTTTTTPSTSPSRTPSNSTGRS